MSETKKSCDNCRYSYFKQDASRHPTIGLLRQHCRNEQYNSEEYTTEMAMEDREQDHCRFWAPMDETELYEREDKNHEEQLLDQGA